MKPTLRTYDNNLNNINNNYWRNNLYENHMHNYVVQNNPTVSLIILYSKAVT